MHLSQRVHSLPASVRLGRFSGRGPASENAGCIFPMRQLSSSEHEAGKIFRARSIVLQMLDAYFPTRPVFSSKNEAGRIFRARSTALCSELPCLKLFFSIHSCTWISIEAITAQPSRTRFGQSRFLILSNIS